MADHKAANRWIQLNDDNPYLKPGWANLIAAYLELRELVDTHITHQIVIWGEARLSKTEEALRNILGE